MTTAPDAAAVAEELRAAWPERSSRPKPSGPEFEAYCGIVARLRDAQRRLAAEGPVIQSPKGDPIPHPALAVEKSCAEQLRRWGSRFDPPRQ